MPYVWRPLTSTEFQGWSFRNGKIVGVVGHQVGVDRRDVAGVDQPQRRVTGGGHHVVLAGVHQADHLVGGVGDLDVDLAAGRLLERVHPVDRRVGGAVLGVAGPGDDVDLALAGAERCWPARPSAGAAGPRSPPPPGDVPDELPGSAAQRAGRSPSPITEQRLRSCIELPPGIGLCGRAFTPRRPLDVAGVAGLPDQPDRTPEPVVQVGLDAVARVGLGGDQRGRPAPRSTSSRSGRAEVDDLAHRRRRPCARAARRPAGPARRPGSSPGRTLQVPGWPNSCAAAAPSSRLERARRSRRRTASPGARRPRRRCRPARPRRR